MGKLNDILNGWKAYVVNDPIATELAKERAELCVKCVNDDGLSIAVKSIHEIILPDFQIKKIEGMVCSKERGGCGCPLSTATRSKDYRCPLGKW